MELKIRRVFRQVAIVPDSRVTICQKLGYTPSSSASLFFASYRPQPLIDVLTLSWRLLRWKLQLAQSS